MKTCNECRWCEPDDILDNPRCMNPANVNVDEVTGRRTYESCGWNRNRWGNCFDGRNWQAKDKQVRHMGKVHSATLELPPPKATVIEKVMRWFR